MATREERIRLTFEADLSDMRKELAKLPEISAKEAKKMVKELEKQYKRAEKAAKKTAAAQKDSSAKIKSGFEAAKQAATGFGGAIGGVGGQVEAFSRSMIEAGTALGPVGAGAIAAGLAVAGMGIAAVLAGGKIIELIANAEELLDKLAPFDDAGVFEPLPAATVASVENFNDSLESLGVLASRVSLEIGGRLAGAFEEAARGALIATLVAKDFFDAIDGLGKIVAVVAPMYIVLTSASDGFGRSMRDSAAEALGLTDALSRWTDKADDLQRVINEGEAAQESARKADEKAAESKKFMAGVSDEARKAAAAERDEARKQAAAKREWAKTEAELAKAIQDTIKEIQDQEAATGKLSAITETATADLLSDEDKIQAAYDAREEAILDVASASKDAGAVKEALDAAEDRRIRDLGLLDQTRADAQKQQLEEVALLEEQFAAASMEIQARRLEQTIAAIDTVGSTITGTIGALTDLRIQATEDNFRAFEESIEKEGEKRREKEEATVSALLESGQISEAEAERRLSELDALEKADEKKIKKAEKMAEAMALKSFKIQKGSQKAQAIIDGARAAIALVPGFAFLGPGAVPAAALVAGTATATQLAVINAQNPPDFPVGGLVADRLPGGAQSNGDHFAIAAQSTEGIVTGRGVDNVGGREGLEALNNGGGMGGMTVILKMDAETIASAILGAPDLANRIVGQLQAEMRQTAGRVPVYGKG
jgi:hypothetical protein